MKITSPKYIVTVFDNRIPFEIHKYWGFGLWKLDFVVCQVGQR